jgi:hypothetical protein
MAVTVGGDILSFCNKCKLALAHIVMSMKDQNTPHKVQCRTCQAQHAYKDPSAQKVKKVTGPKKEKKDKNHGIPVSELWQKELDKTVAKSKAYSIKVTFNKGDVIDHVQFGLGIVQKSAPDRIDVLFKTDIKTLVHNRT